MLKACCVRVFALCRSMTSRDISIAVSLKKCPAYSVPSSRGNFDAYIAIHVERLMMICVGFITWIVVYREVSASTYLDEVSSSNSDSIHGAKDPASDGQTVRSLIDWCSSGLTLTENTRQLLIPTSRMDQ